MIDNQTLRGSNDVIVEKIEIITPSGNAENITFMYDVLSIFENINSPVITGTVQITDNINLYSLIGFNGSEYIKISFKKPGDDFKFTKVFRIYSSTGRQPNENNQSQVYHLHFCSEEMIFSNQLVISRAMNLGTAYDHVLGILTGDLKVNKRKIKSENFERNLGTTDFLFTHYKPFEAIETLTKYSYSFNDSPFLFFENNQGFNFKSLETMFNQNPIASLNYSTAKMVTAPEESAQLTNEMSKFVFDNSFDIINGTKKPTFSGTLHTLDLVRQKYSTINSSLYQKGIGKTLLDSKLPIGNAKNRNGKTLFEEFGTSVKYSMTNSEQTNIQYALDRGYRVTNTNVEKVLLQREMHLSLLNNTKLRCILPGNPNYTIGYLVDFKLPGFTQEEKNERMIDPYQSGKYLITAVRHTITRAEGYETALELSKNSSAAEHDVSAYNSSYQEAVAS